MPVNEQNEVTNSWAMDAYCAQQQSRVATAMPRYQSHKKVWALKIKAVSDRIPQDCDGGGGAMITPEESGFAPFFVEPGYLDKHKPEAGGYFVQYEDGYKSFSPAEAFEGGYTRI